MSHSSSTASPGFRRLAIFTSGWLLLLVCIGAAVRVSGSNAGCPDWPLCYGQLIPPAQTAAWIQFIHRLVAGIGVLLAADLAFITWRDYRSAPLFYMPAWGAVAALSGQLFLGAVTAWSGPHPLLEAAHLLATLAGLTLVLFVATAAHLPSDFMGHAGISGKSHQAYFRSLLFTGAAILFLLFTGKDLCNHF